MLVSLTELCTVVNPLKTYRQNAGNISHRYKTYSSNYTKTDKSKRFTLLNEIKFLAFIGHKILITKMKNCF